MIKLDGLTKPYGALVALDAFSMEIAKGETLGFIGPNGAGKTTVFNLITGVYKPDEGAIKFGDARLHGLKPAQIAGVGVGRTFQNIRLFGQLTVLENLLVACELQKKARLRDAIVRAKVHYEDEISMAARAMELLRVFELHESAHEIPTTLSYGHQRRLEIARAMMLKPRLLLLDEPAAGMNDGEAEGLKTQIQWLREQFRLSIVLVEHNMQVVMGVCEEIHVLDHGETIAHGKPDEIRVHPKVLAAYLGEDENSAAVLAQVTERSRPELPPVSSDKMPVSEKLSDAEAKTLSNNLKRALEHAISEPDLPEFKRDPDKDKF